MILLGSQAKLLQVVLARGSVGRLEPQDWTAGKSRATRTPMMAMTTKSSISVKPVDERR